VGYVFIVAECIVSWKADLQDTMALSKIEVEYMAAVENSKKALWLRGLVDMFGIIQASVQVCCDSQSATYLAKDHMYHKQTKHIVIYRARHWIVIKKVIDLVKISTKENLADMMTKTILVEKFRSSLNFINILQR